VSLAGLPKLEVLELEGDDPAVEHLSVSDMPQLKKLSHDFYRLISFSMSGLPQLEGLCFSGCWNMGKPNGLSEFLQLKGVNWLNGEATLEWLWKFGSASANIERGSYSISGWEYRWNDSEGDLSLKPCSNSDSESGRVTKEELEINFYQSLSSLNGFPRLSNLHKLNMRFWGILRENSKKNSYAADHHYTREDNLEKLKNLELSSYSSNESLIDSSNLHGLQGVPIKKCYDMPDVTGICGLENLGDLILAYFHPLKSLSVLKLENLQVLEIKGCSSLVSLSLSDLPKLKTLIISECENLTEVIGLSELPELELLDLSGCKLSEKSKVPAALDTLQCEVRID
jgi:hypothetical protein